MRGALRLATIAVLVGACSSTPSPAPGGSGAAATGTAATMPAGATGAPASQAAEATPAGALILPPGAQFEAPETLPASGAWGAVSAGADGKTLMAPGRASNGDFRLAVSVDSSSWADRAFIDDKIPGPNGYDADTLDNGWLRGFVVDMASNATGTVAAGTREFVNDGRPTVRSAIWFSADNTSWQQTDLAKVLGSDVAVQVNDVVALDTGFVAIASVGDDAFKQPSWIAVLRSADGMTWESAGKISSVFSLGARAFANCPGSFSGSCPSIVARDGRLLAIGQEYICDTHAGGLFPTRRDGIRWGAQLRIWSSADQGSTWTPVDLAATGIVSSRKPAPTALADCPKLDTMEALQAFTYDVTTLGSFAGVAGQRVVLINGAKTATSTDLTTWTVADVPGIAATGTKLGPKLLVPESAGMALVSLESGATGWAAKVWRTTDGSSWTPVDVAPRPIATDASVGSLRLLSEDLAVFQGPIVARSYRGPLIP